MATKLVGACIVLLCYLLGGFFTLLSFSGLKDGGNPLFLYVIGAIGVFLLLVGTGLLLSLAWRAPPKRTRTTESDESW
jgi:hypothetical protein